MIPTLTHRLILAVAMIFTTESGVAQMIVAHRGASHDAPENTLSAFRLAWQQGADAIEGDFFLTADDQIVCIHDSNTERTGGKRLAVESSTLAELRGLEYGGWKSSSFAGEKIPTLDEVIQTVPDDKTIVIELKSKLRIVPKLVATLREHQAKPIQWMVITFDAPTAAEFKRQMPSIKTHWLTSFKRKPPFLGYRPTAKEIAATVKKTGADGVGLKGMTNVVNREFVTKLKEIGCPEFHVWTVDDIATARAFKSFNAIGITTNIPAVIGPALLQPATP